MEEPKGRNEIVGKVTLPCGSLADAIKELPEQPETVKARLIGLVRCCRCDGEEPCHKRCTVRLAHTATPTRRLQDDASCSVGRQRRPLEGQPNMLLDKTQTSRRPSRSRQHRHCQVHVGVRWSLTVASSMCFRHRRLASLCCSGRSSSTTTSRAGCVSRPVVSASGFVLICN